jgi:hypothetical protein
MPLKNTVIKGGLGGSVPNTSKNVVRTIKFLVGNVSKKKFLVGKIFFAYHVGSSLVPAIKLYQEETT